MPKYYLLLLFILLSSTVLEAQHTDTLHLRLVNREDAQKFIKEWDRALVRTFNRALRAPYDGPNVPNFATVHFVIDTAGIVSAPTLLDSTDELSAKEARRAVNYVKKLTPRKINNQPVVVDMTIRFGFFYYSSMEDNVQKNEAENAGIILVYYNTLRKSSVGK